MFANFIWADAEITLSAPIAGSDTLCQLDFSDSYGVTGELGVFFAARNLTNTEGVRSNF